MASRVVIFGRGLVLQSPHPLFIRTDTDPGQGRTRIGAYLRFFLILIMVSPVLVCGCSYFDKGYRTRSISREANQYFVQGNYEAALGRYRQVLEENPAIADRILFEMGIIYAHPGNARKDYRKSLESFEKIVNDYPQSEYRPGSQMMIFQIHNVINKDKIIAAQRRQMEASRRRMKEKEKDITALQEEIQTLEQKLFILQTAPADKVLIEKKARRLTLLSRGEVIKTYKVALGGDPVGPKERQGDNKTPEGFYIIDSRNRNSGYHLSLRISYPNEKDKMRAKALGVSPGGDIMIHGIKNGLSWVGGLHAQLDWTEGCIAVTDEEIEEIDRLVPDGTIVEIRP
jgi:murein L,D-transpeptidase YafK